MPSGLKAALILMLMQITILCVGLIQMVYQNLTSCIGYQRNLGTGITEMKRDAAIQIYRTVNPQRIFIVNGKSEESRATPLPARYELALVSTWLRWGFL